MRPSGRVSALGSIHDLPVSSRVGLGGLAQQMIPECGTATAHHCAMYVQHCRTLMTTEVQNKRTCLLVEGNRPVVFLETRSMWSFHDNSWSNTQVFIRLHLFDFRIMDDNGNFMTKYNLFGLSSVYLESIFCHNTQLHSPRVA